MRLILKEISQDLKDRYNRSAKSDVYKLGYEHQKVKLRRKPYRVIDDIQSRRLEKKISNRNVGINKTNSED